MFEIGGVSEELAREAMALAAHKLPSSASSYLVQWQVVTQMKAKEMRNLSK
jgi:ribosomal protein L16/L10AE